MVDFFVTCFKFSWPISDKCTLEPMLDFAFNEGKGILIEFFFKALTNKIVKWKRIHAVTLYNPRNADWIRPKNAIFSAIIASDGDRHHPLGMFDPLRKRF